MNVEAKRRCRSTWMSSCDELWFFGVSSEKVRFLVFYCNVWLASDEDVFVVCQITMQCHAGISGLGTTPQSVLEASGQKHAYCSVLANSGSFMDA